MIRVIILCLIVSSCSTLKKTLLYSATSGAITGAVIGKSISPNKKSDTFNTIMGASIGAAASAAVGYMLYKDANPELRPYKQDIEVSKFAPRVISKGMNGLEFTPKLTPHGKRKYLDEGINNKNVQRTIGRRFKQVWKSEKDVIYHSGSAWEVPGFSVVEYGQEGGKIAE